MRGELLVLGALVGGVGGAGDREDRDLAVARVDLGAGEQRATELQEGAEAGRDRRDGAEDVQRRQAVEDLAGLGGRSSSAWQRQRGRHRPAIYALEASALFALGALAARADLPAGSTGLTPRRRASAYATSAEHADERRRRGPEQFVMVRTRSCTSRRRRSRGTPAATSGTKILIRSSSPCTGRIYGPPGAVHPHWPRGSWRVVTTLDRRRAREPRGDTATGCPCSPDPRVELAHQSEPGDCVRRHRQPALEIGLGGEWAGDLGGDLRESRVDASLDRDQSLAQLLVLGRRDPELQRDGEQRAREVLPEQVEERPDPLGRSSGSSRARSVYRASRRSASRSNALATRSTRCGKWWLCAPCETPASSVTWRIVVPA